MSDMRNTKIKSALKDYSKNGLTSNNAQRKLENFGENKFSNEKLIGLKILLKQFINPISIMLIIASLLSIFMEEYSDATVILSIVILNSFLGFVQEFRSGKAVEKLSHLIDKKALVIRDNNQKYISVRKLVKGDTIILRGGDIVPADIKIIEDTNLFVNESQLTGESRFINKSSKFKNIQDTLLFSGSIIERGQCKGVVYATGSDTELGKIASLSKNTKKETPHQKSLAEFSMSVLKMIGVTIILILVSKVFTTNNTNELAEVILFTIALAMAVLPEALPMITTINLSNGALKLSKKNVIVKRLAAVEDLGRINLLCTDKTGTLTEDKLSVKEIISKDKDLLEILSFASIENLELNSKKNMNSFDKAFYEYVSSDLKFKASHLKQINSIPFDPKARRRRIILNDINNNKYYLVVIGSPETLLNISTPTSDYNYKKLISESGNKGMRQLGLAYKEISFNDNFNIIENENDLTFLGFANLIDPLRKTAKDTINTAKKLGIDVKIITGDSLEVAAFVGKEIGLLNEGDKIYTGDELENIADSELNSILERCPIFARVTPEQKYNIIKRLKLNNSVGYQGDGINDAPSLKLADVSIAVNNATDVAKDSSDIVLLEDNLDVIIKGIQYGRSIFVNINKYIKHAMIGNIGSFFSLAFFYVVFSADLPMLPIQLLIANLIQDMPLMTIFSDSVESEEIKKPKISSQINSIMKTSIRLGIFTSIYYLIYLMIIGTDATPETQTNLFLFFNFTQLLIILSVRSKNLLFKSSKPSNMLIGSITLFIIISIAMVYIPPIAKVMGFIALPIIDLTIISLVSIVFILLLDVTKIIINKINFKNKLSI